MDLTACQFEPNHILQWMECRPGLAAYVQAAGSIVAILAGAWGVIWQQRKARILAEATARESEREKAARRTALGYRLDLLVDEIIECHAFVLTSLEVFEGGATLIQDDTSRVDDAVRAMRIDVDWSESVFQDMPVMPQSLQESVTTLLVLVANYNRTTGAALRHASVHGIHTIGDLPALEKMSLDRIEHRMNEASSLLKAMLPPITS